MIRQYKTTDFEQVAAVYNAAKVEEFRNEAFSPEAIPLENQPKLMSLFHKSDIYVFDDNPVRGFAGAIGNQLTWLFVHPDDWGRGIGKHLASHIISLVEGTITLNVALSNSSALRLYQRLGFTIEKQYTSSYQGHPVEVATMSRKQDR